MEPINNIVFEVASYASQYLKENMPKKYVYHDLEHTENVVSASRKLGAKYFLSEKDMNLLEVAAWFHDSGYVYGPEGHEARGADNAAEFLAKRQISFEDIDVVRNCIMATKMPQSPKNLLENIICDSDLNHLGRDIYWERCKKVRQELRIAKNTVMEEDAWLDFEIKFLEEHNYHTDIAQASLGKVKKQHIKQLYKLKEKQFPTEEGLKKKKKGKKKKKKGKTDLGRGVETMYRTTYRTHVNLSAMADNKANIMLSINAIIISIVVSTLVPQIQDKPLLLVPTLLLLGTCMLTIVYATLSTRPKVTEGKFTREDIEEKRSNLLFFGNFYNMEIDDFHWGMTEMIKDEDFLYSSMTRDLYWLGKVLAGKYRLLSICYNVFMYGLIASVVAFGVVYSFLV
ncbi:MAG: putative metal-dependent HD superfamily phosphohydrolase [Maribacter sp.]|jgi:predicted metal-dependent HD superfamily phosphohydrolase